MKSLFELNIYEFLLMSIFMIVIQNLGKIEVFIWYSVVDFVELLAYSKLFMLHGTLYPKYRGLLLFTYAWSAEFQTAGTTGDLWNE